MCRSIEIPNLKSAIHAGGAYADLRFSLWRVSEEVHAGHVHLRAGQEADQVPEMRIRQGGADLFDVLCQDVTEELAG